MKADRGNLFSLRMTPVAVLAILAGFFTAAITANVWLLLLLNLGVRAATVAEVLFLAVFLWWAHGGGPPRAVQAGRANAFRSVHLTSRQWLWGLLAAFSFALAVHASIVLLFRFVSYPAEAFRHGYDLSFLRSQGWRWVAVVISAASAAVCEEVGFRGLMQRPIEQRHGIKVAVIVSSFFFMALHFAQGWAIPGVVPIIFGAGIFLGVLAWSSGSLIPGMIGHFVMDVGMFAYWWTGIAGSFTGRPITETGADRYFALACFAFAIALTVMLLANSQLRKVRTQ